MTVKLTVTAAALAAAVFGAAGAHAAVVNLAPNGLWFTQDQNMATGDFFTDTYQATKNETVRLTDIDVVSDQFGIYINGTFLENSSSVPDWTGLGASDPMQSPPYDSDPATAFSSGFFSTAVFTVHAGDVISIADIHIPPQADGTVYPDGTMAISAVPEPAVWALMLAGFAGLGATMRTRRQSLTTV